MTTSSIILQEVSLQLTMSALNLSRFALHKEVNPLMLVGKNVEEGILKLHKLIITTTRNRHGFSLTGSGVLFDKVFDVVVVDIVCSNVSIGQRAIPRRQSEKRHGKFVFFADAPQRLG